MYHIELALLRYSPSSLAYRSKSEELGWLYKLELLCRLLMRRCSVISEAVQTCLNLRLETLALLGGSWVDYGDYYWGLCSDYKKESIPPFPTKNQTDKGCINTTLRCMGSDK